MPPKFKFTKAEIVNAALELTREEGAEALSARALGDRLHTSARPIFSQFTGMGEVREAVLEAANAWHREYVQRAMAQNEYPPYKASGMAYIRFAREERELFKLLFMRDRTGEPGAALENDDPLLEVISRQVGISREQARLFHLEMWAYVHGIASMIATGFYAWPDELASQTLTDMYNGLKSKYEHQQGE